MKQGFLCVASFLLCAGCFVFLSCEKHHAGELPEVQRDRLTEQKSESKKPESASPNESASPSATPVEFFPEKKP
jgi:hypothetical protein